MNCPTKEQIIEVSKESKSVKLALKKLFPEIFEYPIKIGQIYSWGTDSNGGSGLVINYPNSHVFKGYSFINFITGEIYIARVSRNTTKNDLELLMKREQTEKGRRHFHNCFEGTIRGPKHFKSWCTK